MTFKPPAWFNAVLPPDTHRGLLRRLLIVWGVALVIAILNGLSHPVEGAFAAALVYSYGISTCIWLLSDPARIAMRRWLRTSPPNYWAATPRSLTWLLVSILLGYGAGTLLGDAYSGQSTWSLLDQAPIVFVRYLLGSLAISFGFLFYFFQRERALSLQRQATEARLRLLETQLEPHMLFNTLANLRALIGVDPDKAVQMLDRLNGYLRATLRASRSGEDPQRRHTLQDEFDRLGDYLELMAVRMGPRLRYTLTLPPELAAHPLPPLLLQPLVENAIRHGLEPHIDGGEVTVSASAQDPCLVLTVTDNGAGTDQTPDSAAGSGGSGFGLSQVRERLQTAFGTCHTGQPRFQWQSAPNQGTRITLRLPLTTPRP